MEVIGFNPYTLKKSSCGKLDICCSNNVLDQKQSYKNNQRPKLPCELYFIDLT